MNTHSKAAKAQSSSRGRDWALVVSLNTQANSLLPIYLCLSRALIDAITAGRLQPGSRLPGSRSLSLALGLHRNTVLRAYAELLAVGWLETQAARGTFVTKDIPEVLSAPPLTLRKASASGSRVERLPFTLPKARGAGLRYDATSAARYQLYGGLGDLRLLPAATLGRAYRRALRHAPTLLNYGSPQGNPDLRQFLCTWLRTARGLSVAPDDILITRGSQMALYLAAHAVLAPGATVGVEQLGYPPAWRALEATGANLVTCPLDDQGLDVDALLRICQRQVATGAPLKALYLTPHHQYPTTITLSPARRIALVQLAREFKFFILEDDYDHEFHYDGQPLLPLANTLDAGLSLYVGSLSKVLAPGLRVGFLVAPREVLERAQRHRVIVDRQGDAVTEAALAELMEEGEVQRHIRKVRTVYQERRDHCAATLVSKFGAKLTFTVPAGGMALWVRAHGVHVSPWLDECRKLDVDFQAGLPFARSRIADHWLRLGFAGLTPQEMIIASDRMLTAWQRAAR
jgi:GntR family transcriptional regulator / MocR family aminotransferase